MQKLHGLEISKLGGWILEIIELKNRYDDPLWMQLADNRLTQKHYCRLLPPTEEEIQSFNIVGRGG